MVVMAMVRNFLYRYYYNLVHIYRGEQLIYRDNTRFIPSEFDIAGMGMYEIIAISTIFFSPVRRVSKQWRR